MSGSQCFHSLWKEEREREAVLAFFPGFYFPLYNFVIRLIGMFFVSHPPSEGAPE